MRPAAAGNAMVHNDAFEEFLFMCHYLAKRGDGQITHDETAEIRDVALRVGGTLGLPDHHASLLLNHAANRFQREKFARGPDGVTPLFEEAARVVGQAVKQWPVGPEALLKELRRLADADTKYELGEETIILEVHNAWGVPWM